MMKISQVMRRATLGLALAFGAVSGASAQNYYTEDEYNAYARGVNDGINHRDRYPTQVYHGPRGCTGGELVSGAFAGAVLGAVIGRDKESVLRGAAVVGGLNCLNANEEARRYSQRPYSHRYNHRYDYRYDDRHVYREVYREPHWAPPPRGLNCSSSYDQRGARILICR